MYTKEEITLHSIFELKKFNFHQSDEVNIDEINQYFDLQYPAHIYFIMTRNRISFDKDKTIIKENKVELSLNIQKKGKFFEEKINIRFPDFTLEGGYTVESDYPNSNFLIKDQKGNTKIGGKATYFANEYSEQIKDKDALNYEILYIGESTTKNSATPAINRTEKPHHAVQSILTDFTHKHLDREIFFLFLSFKHNMAFDFPENPKNRDTIVKNIQEYMSEENEKIKIKQRTSLLEWVLIYFFKPSYNDKLKSNPPTLKSKSFKLLSKINLKKCTVSLDLQNVPKIFTNQIEKSDEYIIIQEF